MAELRYNPLLDDWTMVASHRQNRPQMPKDWCPFCPEFKHVPDYDVMEYDNDFPALSPKPPVPDNVGSDFYKTREAHGKCEVVLYSPKHTITLPELPLGHVEKIVDLWVERFEVLRKDPENKYVFIFENRGEEVGVTMPHPHGQIYAYPFIPLKVRTELSNCKNHHDKTGECMICKITKEEQDFKERVIIENDDFIAYIPFFTDYPYGIYIASKRHLSYISDFTEGEKKNFAKILRETTGTMDTLFSKKFPYMMCFYQSPVNGEDSSEYYHFHVEFYPPLRSAEKIKFNASSETGGWAACNPLSVEDTAKEMKAAYIKFLQEDKVDA